MKLARLRYTKIARKMTIPHFQRRPLTTKTSVGRPQKRWVDDIRALSGKQWYQKSTGRLVSYYII